MTITAENLAKRFNREWIFRNLTREFTAGNMYAVTGPNGSGKSTMLQVLWGQVPPSSGIIHYKNSTSLVAEDEIFKHISIAAPYMDLVPEFTLDEQLRFHFRVKKIRENFSIEQLLEIAALNDSRAKAIGNFSSGLKQRIKLLIALYTQCEALFLDEPGTNLDSKAFGWYRSELEKLPSKTLVFIASNNPEEYPYGAHHIGVMDYKD